MRSKSRRDSVEEALRGVRGKLTSRQSSHIKAGAWWKVSGTTTAVDILLQLSKIIMSRAAEVILSPVLTERAL